MGGWAIFLWALAALALFESGDMVVAATFGSIAALLTYLWATKDAREKKRREKLKQIKDEKERQRKQQVRNNARLRFGSVRFVTMLISEFRTRNWQDLEYTKNGVRIYNNRIETPYKTYIFKNYGLERLETADCEALCEYIGMMYAKKYWVEKLIGYVGGSSGSYSGYVGSDGSVSIYRDSDVEEYVEGYKVSAQILPPKPPLKKW